MSSLNYHKLKLWPHQMRAIEESEKYLRDPKLTSNFLVKMPTGSGKTGIMAVLSRICFPKENFLIIVPSIALKDQIICQIDEKFWTDEKKINIPLSELEKKTIKKLLPSTLAELKKSYDADKPVIYVAAVNTLDILRTDHATDYVEFIEKNIHYIFFDEGHKEPAYSWAKAVRDLKKKTILFSATPFRNDRKLFHLDKKNYYYLTHTEAVEKNIVRDIEFRAINGTTRDHTATLKNLIPHLEKDISTFKSSEGVDAKIIIRCKDKSRIKALFNKITSLNKKGWRILGIHETFTKEKEGLQVEVPDEATMKNFDLILHQFKLTEGVDNPDFLILVLYDAFDSERSLIQQLGRVMRNLSQVKVGKAIVYYFENPAQTPPSLIWKNFLRLDENLNTKGLYDISDIITIDSSYEYVYISNKIRKITDIEKIPIKDIQIPTRTAIREITGTPPPGLEQIAELVAEDLEKNDSGIEHKQRLSPISYLIIYNQTTTSPYFDKSVVVEKKYGVVLFYLIDNYLYYFDSQSRVGENILEETLPLNPEKLLLINSNARRLSSMTLANADLGRNAIRGRRIAGSSLENIAPSLNDHNYVATSISAIARSFIDNKMLSRYTGIRSGKLSEYASEYVSIKIYTKWIKAIHHSVITSVKINNYFKRYAAKINPPTDCKAINILLEVDDAESGDFIFTKARSYEWVDIASEVDTEGKFSISLLYEDTDTPVKLDAQIVYDRDKKKYELQSGGLDEHFEMNGSDQTFTRFLNQRQAYRIVTTGCAGFYVFGSFYQPKLSLGGKNAEDLDILQTLIPVKDLATITSEKGNDKHLKATAQDWHKDTLFGLISRQGIGYKDEELLKKYFNFTHLICDDLANEMADFIGIDEKGKRIVLIHAKSKTAQLSASSFHDVCGQVTKNLDMLSPFFAKTPELNIRKFDQLWKRKGIGAVKRMRKGEISGKELWTLFESMIKHPDTTREVYIVSGCMLNKAQLMNQLKQDDIGKVNPETINLIYLLRSTWSAVSALGGKFTVFCYTK